MRKPRSQEARGPFRWAPRMRTMLGTIVTDVVMNRPVREFVPGEGRLRHVLDDRWPDMDDPVTQLLAIQANTRADLAREKS